MSTVDTVNRHLQEQAPAAWASLSALGQSAAFPLDIPFQAGEARGKRYNATIGQITNGAGSPLVLPAVAAGLTGLDAVRAAQGTLYSPVQGLEEVRKGWRRWQRRERSSHTPSTLPLATVGLTHGLSLVADLFVEPGRAVLIPAPFWGNYRQTFGVRRGGRIEAVPTWCEGNLNLAELVTAAQALPGTDPVVVLLNFPSNPGGYSPTREERQKLCDGLAEVAARRPVVAVCDDAYAGLVYEPEIPRGSLFWELVGLHEQLLPVKVDGATKEFGLFGARVGFLTFAFDPASDVALALESKVKGLSRATVGSPVALGQALLGMALAEGDIAAEVESLRLRLEGRYRALREGLSRVDPATLRPLPFNSGCFALVEPPDGVLAERARTHLLESEDLGLVSVGDRFLRIAFCSVSREDIPEVVSRLERGIAAMATQRTKDTVR